MDTTQPMQRTSLLRWLCCLRTLTAYASAINLSGLIDLDMNNPTKALNNLRKALDLRQRLLKPDDPFIASSLSNVSMAYTELRDFERAYATQQEAIDLRLRINSELIGNSYSNMSSLLLRMEKPNEVEEMLGRCPTLKDFTDETFLRTGNPRLSGDMVLLSRIRPRQGRTEDAMRLASKALGFRRRLLATASKSVTPFTMLRTCCTGREISFSHVSAFNFLQAIQMTICVSRSQELTIIGFFSASLANSFWNLSTQPRFLKGQRTISPVRTTSFQLLYGEMGKQLEREECKSRAIDLRKKYDLRIRMRHLTRKSFGGSACGCYGRPGED